MLDQKLLDILACPTCQGPVVANEDHSSLTCNACKVRYRVDGNIPIMLPDEAESLNSAASETPDNG